MTHHVVIILYFILMVLIFLVNRQNLHRMKINPAIWWFMSSNFVLEDRLYQWYKSILLSASKSKMDMPWSIIWFKCQQFIVLRDKLCQWYMSACKSDLYTSSVIANVCLLIKGRYIVYLWNETGQDRQIDSHSKLEQNWPGQTNWLSQQIGTKLARTDKLTLTANWNKTGQGRQIDSHNKLEQNWSGQTNWLSQQIGTKLARAGKLTLTANWN